MTLTLKNIESLAHAIDTIEVFGKHAGSKINLNKTECILLGTLKDQYETISGINVSKHVVKCLVIYLGHDKTECFTQNWMKVYHDIEKLFESWKKRKLTLFGICSIINTLAVPKLIYLSTILELPEENYIKNINRLIFNFLWNNHDRIERNTVIGDIKDGGIGLIDIGSKSKALKAAWVPRLLKTKHAINDFVNSFFKELNIDIRCISITSEISIKKFDIVQKMPQFYKEIFSCFNICKTRPEFKTTESFLKQPIWSNSSFTYKGKTVCFKNWIKSGILFTKHLFNTNGKLKSLDDFATVIHNKSNWLCEYTILQKVFRKYEKNFDFSKKNYIHLEIDKLIPEKQNTNFFYSILKNKKFQISCSQQKLSNEFQISSKSDWERIYFNKIKSMEDKKNSRIKL